jgi:quercetin dioxygenase-like cupin family protein
MDIKRAGALPSGKADVVSIAPGEKHGHGAAATTAVTHIA